MTENGMLSLEFGRSRGTVVKFLVTSYGELISKLHLIIDLRNGWTQSLSSSLDFCRITVIDCEPTIEKSVVIDQDLFVKAFYRQIPMTTSLLAVNDTRQIESLLEEVDKYTYVIKTPTQYPMPMKVNTPVQNAIRELENAISLAECDSLDIDLDTNNSHDSSHILSHFCLANSRMYLLQKIIKGIIF